MPKNIEDTIFSQEEEANDLIKRAAGYLLQYIAEAEVIGDREKISKYTEALNQVEEEYDRFIDDPDLGQQIIEEYPALLARLDEDAIIIPKDLQELLRSREYKKAFFLIDSALRNLTNKIACAEEIGDKTKVLEYTNNLTKVKTDRQHLLDTPEYLKTINEEYPALLARLDEVVEDMPEDLEELIFSREHERASDLISSAMGNLIKRIAAAKKLGDKEKIKKYTKKFNRVLLDELRLMENPVYRKIINEEYPAVLGRLDE